MTLSSLAPLVTAFLLLSSRVAASPVPETRDNAFTNPIGIPVEQTDSLFSGPIPEIVTVSLEDLRESNATEVPAHIPDEVLDNSELDKRYIFGADDRVLWTDNKVYPFSTMGKIQWSSVSPPCRVRLDGDADSYPAVTGLYVIMLHKRSVETCARGAFWFLRKTAK